MKTILKNVTFKDTKICECECHEVGKGVLHVAPCCQLCYETYIVDGMIDNHLLAKAFGEKRKKR